MPTSQRNHSGTNREDDLHTADKAGLLAPATMIFPFDFLLGTLSQNRGCLSDGQLLRPAGGTLPETRNMSVYFDFAWLQFSARQDTNAGSPNIFGSLRISESAETRQKSG